MRKEVRRFFIIPLLLSWYYGMPCGVVHAQSELKEISRRIEEVAADQSRSWEEKVPEMRLLMQMYQQEQAAFEARILQMGSSSELPPAQSPFDAPILSRFAGKEGLPFPSKEESVNPPRVRRKPIEMIFPTPRPGPTAKPYQRPLRCARNETKRTVYAAQDEQEDLILYDYLYISEDLVPSEPEEVFGARTRVVSVPSKPTPGTDLRLKIHQVPCLPFRRRKTGVAEYEDTGVNALRNYDRGFARPGELHPIMQEKLNQRKVSAPPKRR